MRSMGSMVRSMAGGGRMDCDHNGEGAGKTRADTRLFAHARMICFQIQSPVQCSNNSPVASPLPTLNANFPGVPARQVCRREPVSTSSAGAGEQEARSRFVFVATKTGGTVAWPVKVGLQSCQLIKQSKRLRCNPNVLCRMCVLRRKKAP